MSITITQPIIKIGTSKGVTLPAKELKRLNLSEGDQVKITFEAERSKTKLDDEYKAFVSQYGETLKNLSDR